MEICTIGFTGRTAQDFFETLMNAGVDRLVDVRLNNSSQLAAFTKQRDLMFFLDRILGAGYVHEPQLAPTPELLRSYRSKEISWQEYEKRFLDLMEERRIEEEVPKELFVGKPVLLCSETTPDKCHRRLVAEYLASRWGDIKVTHL